MAAIQTVTKAELLSNSGQFSFDAANNIFKVTPVSTDAGNVLSVGADGNAKITTAQIAAAQTVTTLAMDAGGTSFTYTNEAGVASTINLQVADIHVSGGSFNAASKILTLTETGGGGPITVDLSALLESVTAQASATISLTGAGTAASPLSASLVIDPVAGNLLKSGAAGASVATADVVAAAAAATTNALSLAGSVLTSTVNGKAATQDIATAVAPAISVSGTGLLTMTVGSQTATIQLQDVQDAMGTHLFWAF